MNQHDGLRCSLRNWAAALNEPGLTMRQSRWLGRRNANARRLPFFFNERTVCTLPSFINNMYMVDSLAEIHAAAKETVALAEKQFMSNQHEWQFDNAWQEMLNHATMKVRPPSLISQSSPFNNNAITAFRFRFNENSRRFHVNERIAPIIYENNSTDRVVSMSSSAIFV